MNAATGEGGEFEARGRGVVGRGLLRLLFGAVSLIGGLELARIERDIEPEQAELAGQLREAAGLPHVGFCLFAPNGGLGLLQTGAGPLQRSSRHA